jgi:hypothetical protein
MYFNKFKEVRGKSRRNLQGRVSRKVLKTTIIISYFKIEGGVVQRSYFYLGRPHCSSELGPILSLIFTITLLLAACCQVFCAELRLGRPSSASAATSPPFLSSLLLSPAHYFSIRAPEIQSSWSASLHRSFEAPRFTVWPSLSPVASPPAPYRNSLPPCDAAFPISFARPPNKLMRNGSAETESR